MKGLGLGAGTGLMAVLLLIGGMVTALAQEEAIVRVVPSKDKVEKDGGEFEVDVVVDGAENLAAFQFMLEFDPGVLQLVQDEEGVSEAECGSFLGSGGRTVQPVGATATDNSVTFRCVTLGPPVSLGGPVGPSGSGTLASVRFRPVQEGESPLTLHEVILLAAEVDEQERPIVISSTTEDGAVTVTAGGGFRWLLWGPIIGVGALVLVAVGGGLVWLRLFARRA